MISSSSTTRIVPCLDVAISQSLLPAGAALPRHRLRHRERHREPRALPHDAVALDVAVVLANDAVGDREPETRAAPNRLRREERIVDARQLFRRNARSGV